VLALTDGPRSPLVQFADLSLYVRTDRRLASNADSAVLAVIEALCDAVAYRAQRSVKAAAEVSEFVLPWLFDPQSSAAGAAQEPSRAASKVARAKAEKVKPGDGAKAGNPKAKGMKARDPEAKAVVAAHTPRTNRTPQSER
jgi:hypothetical protein